MRIRINNEPVDISGENVNVNQLLAERGVSSQGTAVAVNGRLAPRNRWESLILKENDDIVIITAAFGG